MQEHFMISSPKDPLSEEVSNLQKIVNQKDSQIRDLLKQLDILKLYQKEMHHRIKNHLTTIITLFRLQNRYSDNAEINGLLKDCESRVHAIALIHDQLYKLSHEESTSCEYYVESILKEMNTIYQVDERKIQVTADIESFQMPIEYMMPCGLIITELLANSYKYAFPDDWTGKPLIDISIFHKDGYNHIDVCDNGIGFDASKPGSNSQSLGIQIVTMLVEHQLGGKIHIDNSKGTCVRIKFAQKE